MNELIAIRDGWFVGPAALGSEGAKVFVSGEAGHAPRAVTFFAPQSDLSCARSPVSVRRTCRAAGMLALLARLAARKPEPELFQPQQIVSSISSMFDNISIFDLVFQLRPAVQPSFSYQTVFHATAFLPLVTASSSPSFSPGSSNTTVWPCPSPSTVSPAFKREGITLAKSAMQAPMHRKVPNVTSEIIYTAAGCKHCLYEVWCRMFY